MSGDGMLRAVTGKLKELASDIITVRTGTVVSDFASMTATIVVLDNDPDAAQVQALCLTEPLPAQTRVMMLAYPDRGLVIIGAMVEVAPLPPLISGAASFSYTSNGTFTAANAAPFRSIFIEARAGGGAGGGAPATTAGNSSGGGGGGGGGYARQVISTAGLTYPLQVNIGGGGSGVSGATGGGGGDTSVVDNNGAGTILCRALGGAGGNILANAATVSGQADVGGGGSADFGDFGNVGSPGLRSVRLTATVVLWGAGGAGAMGGGGGAEVGIQANGNVGQVYGGGGSGAHANNGGGAQTGGNGASGRVMVTGIP